MFRLKGGETHGNMGPRTPSRISIISNVTYVTILQRAKIIVPIINDFLDAE
jgi:hypothetical protein